MFSKKGAVGAGFLGATLFLKLKRIRKISAPTFSAFKNFAVRNFSEKVSAEIFQLQLSKITTSMTKSNCDKKLSASKISPCEIFP